MKNAYSIMKKAVIGASILASSYLPMTAKAQDNLFAAAEPSEMQKITAKAGENIEARAEKGEYSHLFTRNRGTEFLWGLTRPLHLWNTDSENGNTLVYPYLINGRKTAFTGAFEAGGIFSPLEGLVATIVNGAGYLCGAKDSLMYNAFADNWALTAGVIPHYALLALAGGSSGGSGSTPANPDNPDKKDDGKTNPKDPVDQGGNL